MNIIDNYFVLIPLTTSTVAGPGDAGADGEEEEEADHARVMVLAADTRNWSLVLWLNRTTELKIAVVAQL